MADEDPGRELPQRVRGAARSGSSVPAPSPSPVLSEELRQRMRAAVTAERSGAATKQDEAPGGEDDQPQARAVGPAQGHPARAPGRIPALGRIRAARCTRAACQPSARRQRRADPPRMRSPSGSGPPPSRRPRSGPAPPAPAGSPRPAGRSRARRTARFVAVVLVIGVLAVAAVSYFGRSSAASPTSAAAARQAAEARAAAASWVAQQVSRGVKVSCDPVMCAALRARGFPSGQLLVLGSASEVPTSSAVVVETPAVLRLFGSSLATAFAPAVLASFGSGPSLVTVRVIARNGAAAYQTKLNTDLRARKTAGAALLGDSLISVPGSPASAFRWPGRLAARARARRSGRAPADHHRAVRDRRTRRRAPNVPLRFVDLAEDVKAAHLGRAAYVKVGARLPEPR